MHAKKSILAKNIPVQHHDIYSNIIGGDHSACSGTHTPTPAHAGLDVNHVVHGHTQ
jgi:hypothetical protein